MMCAYSGRVGTGTCDGDSGGPLTHDGKLIGIVSWILKKGESCADGHPDGYVRISTFNEWINKNIAE